MRIKKPKKTQDEIWQDVIQDSEKLKYFRFNWAKNMIRRGSYRWPGRFNAKKRNYIKVPITYKNGTTKLVEKCFCSECGRIDNKGNFQLDHVITCIPLEGWDSFDGYIERMMCLEDGFIVKCYECHANITKDQNEQRRKFKNNKN